MSNIAQSIYKMYLLEELAERKNMINRIHPLAKLAVTIVYLIFVVSFGRYEVSQLLPFVVYPAIIVAIADIPLKPLFKRMLAVFPFVFGIGVFNLFLDTKVMLSLNGLPITYGTVSFIGLLFKSALTVMAALLLLATTGMNNIIRAFRILHIPRIFVIQLLLMYRYVSVLLEEAARLWNAYSLRAPGQKGIKFELWGSLAGQMLIRTYERAQRVYEAMVLRGFNGDYEVQGAKKASAIDYFYLAVWILFFMLIRYCDLPSLIGSLVLS